MSVINRVPKGLLSLFDAKTQGQTPKTIEPELSVGIDAINFYYADIPFLVETNTAAGEIVEYAAVAPIEVPAGEMWAVYSIGLRAIVTAGTGSVGLTPVLTPTPVGTFVEIGPRVVGTSLAVAEGISNGTFYQPPLLISGGAKVSCFVNQNDGTITVTNLVLYKRLVV